MRMQILFWVVLLGLGQIGRLCRAESPNDDGSERGPKTLAEQAAALRKEGPAALERLLQQREEVWLKVTVSSRYPAPDQDKLNKLERLIDLVGAQKDCTISKLFWYTDFEAARQAAAELQRPILSLRLLGDLREDCSCANSRFFRSVLYANENVSQFLRENFVLHWESVRPVPKVTVDFGDGRKLVRTVTGNSAHYVLASDGQPIDVIPGLYGPDEFLQQLAMAFEMAQEYSVMEPAPRDERLRRFHQYAGLTAAQIFIEAKTKLIAAKAEAKPSDDAAQQSAPPANEAAAQAAPPPAAQAMPRAMTKARVEDRLLRPITMRAETMEHPEQSFAWEKLETVFAASCQVGPWTRHLIQIQTGRTDEALEETVRNLEKSLAIDTARNELDFHRTIHKWFSGDELPRDVKELNRRVYSELFLTPDSDPWLGLVRPDDYTGLDGNGFLSSR